MQKPSRLVVFFVALLFAAPVFAGDDAIQIARVTPYQNKDHIDAKIITECTDLGAKLSKFLNESATEDGVATQLVDNPNPKAGGRVLMVQITNAISAGSAFVGHSKTMTATAELFENGVSVGTKTFTRSSGGGFGGAYKSSCSVLGRCSKALGQDFADWLKERK